MGGNTPPAFEVHYCRRPVDSFSTRPQVVRFWVAGWWGRFRCRLGGRSRASTADRYRHRFTHTPPRPHLGPPLLAAVRQGNAVRLWAGHLEPPYTLRRSSAPDEANAHSVSLEVFSRRGSSSRSSRAAISSPARDVMRKSPLHSSQRCHRLSRRIRRQVDLPTSPTPSIVATPPSKTSSSCAATPDVNDLRFELHDDSTPATIGWATLDRSEGVSDSQRGPKSARSPSFIRSEPLRRFMDGVAARGGDGASRYPKTKKKNKRKKKKKSERIGAPNGLPRVHRRPRRVHDQSVRRLMSVI